MPSTEIVELPTSPPGSPRGLVSRSNSTLSAPGSFFPLGKDVKVVLIDASVFAFATDAPPGFVRTIS
jgi:hypothetical protein